VIADRTHYSVTPHGKTGETGEWWR